MVQQLTTEVQSKRKNLQDNLQQYLAAAITPYLFQLTPCYTFRLGYSLVDTVSYSPTQPPVTVPSQPMAANSSVFGSSNAGGSVFGQTTPSTSSFGQQPTTSVFGGGGNTGGSVFGQPSSASSTTGSSVFGQPSSPFGQPSTQSTSFGGGGILLQPFVAYLLLIFVL